MDFDREYLRNGNGGPHIPVPECGDPHIPECGGPHIPECGGPHIL